MIVITGTPRSLFEMEFVAGMFACETCGDWRPVDWRTGGTHADWLVHAACPRCASERAYAFRSEIDLDRRRGCGPRARRSGALADPRTVRAPARDRSLGAHDRERAGAARPRRVGGESSRRRPRAYRARRAREISRRRRDSCGVPSQRGRAHRSRDAGERYQRAWIRHERAHWEANAKRIALDAPRILAANRQKPPLGTLDADALAAHRVWLESNGARGRRLVVVTAYAAARMMRGGELTGSRFDQLNLADADLVGTALERAELFEVDLTRARIETATLTGARLVRCKFTGAIAENTSFSSAVAEDCDFTRTKLATSQWTTGSRRALHVCRRGYRRHPTRGLALHRLRPAQRDASRVPCSRAPSSSAAICAASICPAPTSAARRSSSCAFSTAYRSTDRDRGLARHRRRFLRSRRCVSDLGDADDLYAELTSS